MARHAMRKPSLRARLIKPEHQQKQQQASTSSTAAAAASAAPGPSISFEAREALPLSRKLEDLDRQLKLTRTSTASLGKYDKKLSGEPEREKGIRRKFESNLALDAEQERLKYLDVLKSLDNDAAVKRKRQVAITGESASNDVVNTRKAIRAASKGRGSASLVGQEGGANRKKARGAVNGNGSSGGAGAAAKGRGKGTKMGGGAKSSSSSMKSGKSGGGGGKTKSSLGKGKRK